MKTYVVAALLGLAAFSGGQAFAGPLPVLDRQAVPGHGQPLVLVQGMDPTIQIQQLQEEIRQLNGRIEEMGFQLLQMQETIRKAQEDNEFRFQELERGKGKKSGALEQPAGQTPADDVAAVIEQPAEAGALPDDSTVAGGSPPAPAGDVAAVTPPPAGTVAPGEATLGSIELDANGNPVRATITPGLNNGSGSLPGVDAGQAPAAPGTETASLGSEADSYQVAYGHVLSGDYALAETEFQAFIAGFPKSPKLADANFWLGEAYYSQGKYNESAKTFLNAHQNFGKSPKAPEMLLKLGMSLAALDNKDTACATMREVSKRYPKASRAVINKVASEVKRLGC